MENIKTWVLYSITEEMESNKYKSNEENFKNVMETITRILIQDNDIQELKYIVDNYSKFEYYALNYKVLEEVAA